MDLLLPETGVVEDLCPLAPVLNSAACPHTLLLPAGTALVALDKAFLVDLAAPVAQAVLDRGRTNLLSLLVVPELMEALLKDLAKMESKLAATRLRAKDQVKRLPNPSLLQPVLANPVLPLHLR